VLFGVKRGCRNADRRTAFQVQGPDDYGPNGAPGRFNDAMSRPPSRVTNRSPLGNVIDLTADSATGRLIPSLSTNCPTTG
jgi:hypothetical protein